MIAGSRVRHARTAVHSPGPLVCAAFAVLALVVTAAGGGSSLFHTPFAPSPIGTRGLAVEETSNGHRCSTASEGALDARECPSINRLGGDLEMLPGRTVATRIVLTNTGFVGVSTVSFTPQTDCTQAAIDGHLSGRAQDLCGRIRITVTSGENRVFSGTAATLGDRHGVPVVVPGTLEPGGRMTVTFAATMDPAAGNAYQGIGAALPIDWTFAP